MGDYSLVQFLERGKMMRNQHRSNPAPSTVSSSVRTRDYLTTREIDALMAAARQSSRYGHRDATMICSATDMVCGLPSCVIFSGAKSSWRQAVCTCGE